MLRTLRYLAVVAVVILLAGSSRPTTFRYLPDPSWPKPLPHNWIIGQVGGVAVDAQDHVWILYRPHSLSVEERGATENPPRSKCCVPAPPVIEFDRAGNVLRAWGGPVKGAPYTWPQNEHGLYIDNKGYLYINGNGPIDGQVLKFKPDGTFVKQFGSPGPPTGSQDTTRFGRPAQVRVDPLNNELYVADGYHNHRLIVLDADTGAFHRMWGAYGHAPIDPPDCDPTIGSRANSGDAARQQIPNCVHYRPSAPPDPQFQTPVDCVWVSKDAIVYVCDRANDRLQLFHKNGTFIREIRYEPQTLGRGSVWDLYFWPKQSERYIFMPDGENDEIRIYRRSDGAQVGSFGRGGHELGNFEWVHKIAIDSQGNVYAGEVGPGERVQKFRPVQMPYDVHPSDSDMLGVALALPPASVNPQLRTQAMNGAALAVAAINERGGIKHLAGAHLRLTDWAPVAVLDADVSPFTGRLDASRGHLPSVHVDTDSTPQAAELAASFLQYLRSHEHMRLSIAVILYVENAYGRSHLAAAERIAAAAKLRAIAMPYPAVITDAEPFADRIGKLRADVVFPVSFVTDPRKKPTPSLLLILRELQQRRPRPLILGGGAGFVWPELGQVLGPRVNGIMSTSMWNAGGAPRAFEPVAAAYQAKFGTFMPEYAGETYVAMWTIARALDAGARPAPLALRPVIVQWQHGVPVTIYPRSAAAAPFMRL